MVGDVLMTGRLLLIGALAMLRSLAAARIGTPAEVEAYRPEVAVLIPAYNEEKVIERTVRAALDSDYPNLRVIVIDDGSNDARWKLRAQRFQQEEAAGRVLMLTKPNSGKAEALNFGLEHLDGEEIFVGIDADTVIAPDAISLLVPHFLDPKVGAIAGNAKVGNRVNLWTRWQALEYITSQNFERRALNTLGAVSVVPGAIGAWRVSAVREAGGYHTDTVAEDADLTMALLRRGYRVEYEDRRSGLYRSSHQREWPDAAAFPLVVRNLAGGVEASRSVARKGALGWVAMPNIVIFQIIAAARLTFHRLDVCGRRGLVLHPEIVPSGIDRSGEFPEAGGFLRGFPGHRLHHLRDCLRAGTPAAWVEGGRHGCSARCGCSASLTANCSRWF